MQWKIKVGDTEYSADSTETLKQWYHEGRVRADSYVYHPVLEKWMYVRELEELRPPAPAVPVSPIPVPSVPTPTWNPGVAALLSLVIPGAGQMYKGHVGVGLAWLLFVGIGYLLYIVPGVILHLVCILNAATGGKPAPRTIQTASTSLSLPPGAARGRSPLVLVGVVLLIIWLVGLISGYTLGGFVHLALLLAIVLLIVGLIQGK